MEQKISTPAVPLSHRGNEKFFVVIEKADIYKLTSPMNSLYSTLLGKLVSEHSERFVLQKMRAETQFTAENRLSGCAGFRPKPELFSGFAHFIEYESSIKHTRVTVCKRVWTYGLLKLGRVKNGLTAF